MSSGDIGMVLVAVIVIGGGIYLLQSGALQNLGLGGQAPVDEAPPEEDTTTDVEEQGASQMEEPMPEQEDIAFPIPVYIPVPGLSRREICRRQPPFGFGGSCNSECRNFGMNSGICRTCISYCGRPTFVGDALPRPRTRTPSFPRSGRECPRGQRYNWSSKRCEDVQSKPTNQPTCPSNKKWSTRTKKCEDVMTTQPVSEPAAPAESAFAFSYRGVY